MTDYLHVAVAWTPVTRTIWVSAIFVAVPLTIARLIFNRRDVATTSQPTTPPPRAPHSTRAT